MVKKLKLSLRVDRKRWNNKSGELTDKVFVTVDWFENENFINQYNKKSKEKFIEQKLKRTSRTEISDKIDIGKKEEVVVTMQGNHSLDNALFHEEIDIPDNLVDDEKTTSPNNRGSISW